MFFRHWHFYNKLCGSPLYPSGFHIFIPVCIAFLLPCNHLELLMVLAFLGVVPVAALVILLGQGT